MIVSQRLDQLLVNKALRVNSQFVRRIERGQGQLRAAKNCNYTLNIINW